jgi:medium-chain acyl-[acyl-carrier-protein] hydrolase
MNTQINGKPTGLRQMPATAWLAKPKISNDATLRLFCFPYAGGGASIYRGWSAPLPMVELLPVQLPGRETRLKEAPYSNARSLLRAMGQALLPYFDRPFCFFGHSMGALLAFELAREIRREYALSPRHIFVSGRRAPAVPLQNKIIHNLPQKDFIEKLRELNGTLPAALEHLELVQLLLPMLKADFAICETYEYKPEEPLNCGISAFGGLDDAHVKREHMEGWREQTTGEFKLRMLPGNHFFLHESQQVLLQILFRELHCIRNKQFGTNPLAVASNSEKWCES